MTAQSLRENPVLSKLVQQQRPIPKHPYWKPIPNLHQNETIAIIAGGASVTQEDVDRCKPFTTIAINDAYLLAPWATWLYHCDLKWWEWHKDDPRYCAFTGFKITNDALPDQSVLRVHGKQGQGLHLDPDGVNNNGNSGSQALNIAYHFGASRILLLGYDLKIGKNGAAHWFGDHPDRVRSQYAAWISGYSIAAEQLAERGVEVINCSPDSALNCFKKESLASVLSSEQGQV